MNDFAIIQNHGWRRFHGHTHDPFDDEVYDTRVVCNLCGYAPHDLAPEFRPDLVVDI